MRGSWRLLVGCALVSPLLLLLVAQLLPGVAFTAALGVNAVSVLATATAMYVTASAGDPRLRRARLLFAVALAASAAGFVVVAVHTAMIGHVPLLSLGGLTRLIWVPCALAGLFAIPTDRHHEGGRLRVVLDGLVATTALGLPFWMLVLDPIYSGSDQSGITKVILISYPVADFVVAVAAFSVAAQARGDLRRFLRLVAVGLALVTVADAQNATNAALGVGAGFGWPSLLIQTGLATLLCAALLPTATDLRDDRRRRHVLLDAALPHAPLAVAVVIGSQQSLAGRPVDAVTVVTGSLLILGMIARQIVYTDHLGAIAHRLTVDATRDALTGLANRRSFLAALETSLAERRAGDVAVVLLDLNGFKEVNDTFGHEHGDSALCDFAARLEATVAESCLTARLGGDEFAVLVVGVDAERRAWRSARALVQTQRSGIGSVQLAVGASAGVAVNRTADTTSAVLRRADLAMYDAKRTGPSAAAVFTDDMAERAERRHLLTQALPGAAARGELEIVYQPLLQLDDGSIAGAEALLRWHSPVHGQVSPAEFIPLAEDTGVIPELGSWVLRTAVRQLAAWDASGRVLPRLAVNVSPHQLTETFAGHALEVATAHGVSPSRLTLEITESALPDLSANHCLDRLREGGFAIAMDDFGAGFSSLAQLAQLPVDTLKFDREFIAGVATPNGRRIVEAVIALAVDLGLGTVAEGVETAEQAEAVRTAGCVVAQGYHFSRPLPAAALAALLDAPTVPEPRTSDGTALRR